MTPIVMMATGPPATQRPSMCRASSRPGIERNIRHLPKLAGAGAIERLHRYPLQHRHRESRNCVCICIARDRPKLDVFLDAPSQGFSCCAPHSTKLCGQPCIRVAGHQQTTRNHATGRLSTRRDRGDPFRKKQSGRSKARARSPDVLNLNSGSAVGPHHLAIEIGLASERVIKACSSNSHRVGQVGDTYAIVPVAPEQLESDRQRLIAIERCRTAAGRSLGNGSSSELWHRSKIEG